MSNFTIEQLDSALDHKGINMLPAESKNEFFNRNRRFESLGSEHVIEWYSNISYLKTNGVTVMFYTVKQSSTWPNGSKMDLRFEDEDGEVVAVLPIEMHEH